MMWFLFMLKLARKAKTFLFNDTLNTFYLYKRNKNFLGVGHRVKDHSDSWNPAAAATWATPFD